MVIKVSGRRRLVTIAALVVAAVWTSACAADDPGDASESASSFCSAWADLQSFLEADELPDEQAVTSYLTDRAAAEELVPDVLRDDWDGLVAFDDVFIEVLYSIGFDAAAIAEPIVVQAFGSVGEAEATEQRHDAAVATIDRWATANCAGTGPDQFTFCELWSEIHEYLTAGAQLRPGVDREDAANVFADQVAEADAAKPADVPDAWDSIADYNLARHDVLVTVGFDEELISDELLSDAFGSVAAAAEAEAAAEAAVDVVQEWSIASCGGLCVRSSEITEALGRLGSLGDDRGLLEEPAERSRLLADLVLGDQLVPDELREEWDDAADAVRKWVALWEQYDFDPELLEREDVVDTAVELYRSTRRLYVLDELEGEERRALEAWQAGAEVPEYLEELVRSQAMRPPTGGRLQQIFVDIEDWVDRNCTGVGGPGVVEVELPRVSGAAGGSFAVALGEVGAGVDDLTDANRFVRGACEPISRSPFGVGRAHDGSEEPVRWRLRARPDVVDESPYLCEGWEDERPVEPGTYGLVVAQYPGLGLAALDAAARPSHCLTIEVEVAGDTLVQLPELPPCDVEVPESERWQLAEPVDPSVPGAGTLAVRFPNAHVPESAAEGEVPQVEVRVLALPAGTTLNQVGREQVAPSGAACVELAEDRVDPELGERPVVLPLASLAPGFQPGCLDAAWLNGEGPAPGQRRGEPPAAEELSAVVLARGAYDLRLQAVYHDPEEGAQSRCATLRDVVVDGDTIVDLPVFEECP